MQVDTLAVHIESRRPVAQPENSPVGNENTQTYSFERNSLPFVEHLTTLASGNTHGR